MRIQRERIEYGTEFLKVLDSKSQKEFIDILNARKIIEGYQARLAAINITPDIAEEMKNAIDLQAKHSKKEISAEYDALFHKLISSVAGNKVLDVMLDLLRQDGQLGPALVYIRKQMKASIVVDHEKIMAAIVSNDPDAAEQAMVVHIENLIKDVKKYWEKISI